MRVRSTAIYLLILFVGGLVFAASPAMAVNAQANVQVVSDKATINFPENILFAAEFKDTTNIASAVLQYGVNQLTCGTIQAEAFPSVTTSTDVKAQWTWEMRESGSLPPGATVWWQWLVTDSSGATFTSPKQSVLWLDNAHAWQTIGGGNINLHIYDEPADFGNQLHDAATQALQRLSTDIGLTTDQPVDIYIYATYADLQNAVLYAPSWAGGQAFPESNIVIIGVPSNLLDYGRSAEAHELTHVLVGHFTFSCLNFIPQWLNEGLAVYGEGGPQQAAQDLFNKAVADKQLPSLRSLIGQFSAEQDRALLSYAEAHSVVNFMAKTYGQNKMLALLTNLKNAQTMDEALQGAYGTNLDGLENAWRASLGLPEQAGSGNPTPVPTPTVVPTIVPIGAVPVAQPQVTTPQPSGNLPTATQGPVAQNLPSTPVAGSGQPLMPRNIATILVIAGACLIAVLVVAALVIFFIVRRQNRRPQ